MKTPIIDKPKSDNKAKEIREDSKKIKSIEDILEKYGQSAKKTSDELGDLFTSQKNVDVQIIDKLNNFDKVFSLLTPKQPLLAKAEKADDIIVSKVPIISTEETQLSVLDNIINLNKLFPEIKDILKGSFANTKDFIKEIPSIGSEFSNQLSELFGKGDNSVFSIMANQLTEIKELFIKADLDKKTKSQSPKVKKEEVKDSADLDQKKSGIIKLISGIFGSATSFLKPVLSLFSGLVKIILPFRSLLVGGVFGLALVGFLNFIGDFTKTFDAISKLFTGGFSNIIPNLVNVITSFFGDLSKSFEGSSKLSDLGKSLSDIFNKQLVPTFNYLVNDIFYPFVTEMANIFTNELAPRFKAVLDYINGPGGKDIMDGVKVVGELIANGLVFLFKKVLPPALDIIGAIVKALVTVIKTIYPYVKSLFTAIMDIDGIVLKVLAQFVIDFGKSISEIFSADNWTDRLMGVVHLLNSISDGIFSFVKNSVDWLLQKFGINIDLGIGDKKLSQIIYDLTMGVFNKAVEIKDLVVSKFAAMFDEAVKYVTDLDIVGTIKTKLEAFSKAILDIIPSLEDIEKFIRDSAKSIYGGEALVNMVLGEKASTETNVAVKPPEVSQERITTIKNIERGVEDKSKSSPTITSINNTNNSYARSKAGNVTGVARTTATSTPSDKKLYGGGGGF